MKVRTTVLRAGMLPPVQGRPLHEGVTFAGNFHAMGDPAASPYVYGRYHNPTWTQFERALSELEGGSALCFASGMAAVTAVFSTTLQTGNIVVLPSDCYYTSRMLAEGFFAQLGIQVRKVPAAANAQLRELEGAKLLWLESPTNPRLDVCDIALFVEAAHAKNVLVAVDNTTPHCLDKVHSNSGPIFPSLQTQKP